MLGSPKCVTIHLKKEKQPIIHPSKCYRKKIQQKIVSQEKNLPLNPIKVETCTWYCSKDREREERDFFFHLTIILSKVYIV